ncbi:MAG: transposon-encoded TnpW family protein [Oscillospiraceae bacterium]|nr:transposon-encoded TnpW family protein [Oscillospiraceae bacterium]
MDDRKSPLINTLFTEDETIVKKIGNTTYILNAKYKKDAREGVVDKLLRLIENPDNNRVNGLENRP